MNVYAYASGSVCVHVFRRQQHAEPTAAGMAQMGVKSGQARHKIRVSTFGAATAHVGAAMSGAIAPASALLRSSIFEAQQVISTHKAGKIMWPTAVAAAPIPCTRRK